MGFNPLLWWRFENDGGIVQVEVFFVVIWNVKNTAEMKMSAASGLWCKNQQNIKCYKRSDWDYDREVCAHFKIFHKVIACNLTSILSIGPHRPSLGHWVKLEIHP